MGNRGWGECKKNDSRWRFFAWPDGTQQWKLGDVQVERVLKPNTRRKRWCIVDRSRGRHRADTLYPPKVAGPFPNLKIAMLAAELMS